MEGVDFNSFDLFFFDENFGEGWFVFVLDLGRDMVDFSVVVFVGLLYNDWYDEFVFVVEV